MSGCHSQCVQSKSSGKVSGLCGRAMQWVEWQWVHVVDRLHMGVRPCNPPGCQLT